MPQEAAPFERLRRVTETYRLPPLVLAFWRDSFVVLTLLAVLGPLRPRLLHVTRAELRYLIGYGFVLAVFNSLWAGGVVLRVWGEAGAHPALGELQPHGPASEAG